MPTALDRYIQPHIEFVLDEDWVIAEPLVLRSGTRLRGPGRLVAGADMDALVVIDGASDVTVDGLTLVGNGHAVNGIEIADGASDIRISNVRIRDCFRGVNLYGTEVAPVSDVTLRDCHITHGAPTATTSQYGVYCYHAEGIRLHSCTATGHWIGGVSLVRGCDGIEIVGGDYSRNGLLGPNGNGIHIYTGPGAIRLVGVRCAGNDGSGVVIKTGPLSADYDSYVHDVQLLGCELKGNGAFGLEIVRHAGFAGGLPSCVSVQGGVFAENASHGIYCGGRNVAITSPIVRGNGGHGVLFAVGSLDCSATGVHAYGNGTTTPGAYSGVQVEGKRIQVVGGHYLGPDARAIANDEELVNETQVQGWSVKLGTAAVDCTTTAGVALYHEQEVA